MAIQRPAAQPRVVRQRPGIERRTADRAGALAGVLLVARAAGTTVDALAAYLEFAAGLTPGNRPGAARGRTVTTAAAYARRWTPAGYRFNGAVDLDGTPVAPADALVSGTAVLLVWAALDWIVCDLVSASAHRRAVEAELDSGRVHRALEAGGVMGARSGVGVTVRLVAPAAGLAVTLEAGVVA